jgi:tRNA-2-methylthio-N6-dimethylallyladenosine synthase
MYSRRPGTPAASMPDDVTDPVRQQRLAILQARIRQQAAAFSAALVGTQQRILVTGRSPRDPGKLQGRTECNRTVNFPSDDHGLVGAFVRVGIEAAFTSSLGGLFVAVDE